jgi:hypothetical protein
MPFANQRLELLHAVLPDTPPVKWSTEAALLMALIVIVVTSTYIVVTSTYLWGRRGLLISRLAVLVPAAWIVLILLGLGPRTILDTAAIGESARAIH